MNILILSNMYLPHIGGVEIVVKNLANRFKEMGHQVNIVSSRTSRSLKAHEYIDDIEVTRIYLGLPGSSLKSLLVFLIYFIPSILYLKRFVREKKPDVLNFHFVDSTGFYVLMLKRWFKLPLVVSIHGNDIHKLPLNSRLQKIVLTKVLSIADSVTSCSTSLLKDAAHLVPGILHKSMVTYNGVDKSEFSAFPSYRSDAPYVFTLGRFEYKKGFDLLIKAFNTVSKKYPRLYLFIGGSGEEEAGLRNLISEWKMEEKVKLLGPLDRQRVVSLFKGCEFFVLPSRIEPLGIVNLEAMAAGKAVVATRVDGVPEIIKNGENGILVEPENPDKLAEAMLELLDDLELRKQMELKNMQAVKKKYSWEKVADSYLAAYGKAGVTYESGV